MGNFDFTGFKFGSWSSHNEQTGQITVVRVSSSDRYEEELQPEIKDKTAEVPGVDGEYYFGSDYGTRSFNIDIAFDSLTEEQFRQLRRAFGTKQIKRLVFDERPYKYYLVKLENPIELSYVCFDEPKKELTSIEGIRYKDENDNYTTTHTIMRATNERARIYKGEGKIALKAYFPFAKSVYKQVLATEEEEDWVISSGLLSEQNFREQGIDEYVYDSEQQNGVIKVYNAGDVETGFRLYIPFNNNNINACNIIYNSGLIDDEGSASLYLKQIEKIGNDIGILINTTNGLIQGVSSLSQNTDGNWSIITSGNIYNKYIDYGYLFKLQPNDNSTQSTITITGIENAQIFYDYLYF